MTEGEFRRFVDAAKALEERILVLIGMGAIVMDNVQIGTGSIVAAGAVVLENTVIEPGSIYAGVPAKKVKSVSESLQKQEIERISNNYLMYSKWFK